MHLYMTARTKIAFIALCLLCCGLPTLADGLTIPDAKKLANDQPVTLIAKVVTYASANFFYIEEDSRCIGIRVEKTAHGLTVGMRADVSGAMKTNDNRERYILASSAVQTPEPNAYGVVSPVGMNNAALGGANWQVVGTGGQRGPTGSLGLNNVGLLVKTWGRYEQQDATTFAVDDGSGLFVKCTVPSGTFLHSGWQYVSVTGISSMFKYNNSIYPQYVLIRDIEVTQPVEVVSVPNIPTGNVLPFVSGSYSYSTTGSTCGQGHPVEYSFDWGDSTSSTWSTSTSASHAWSTPGSAIVTVTARCQVHASISATSAGLPVNAINGSCEMIYIPAGSFLMGNSNVGDDAVYHWGEELPQHSVALLAYYIGKYEVTRGEYRQFMNAGGYSNSSYWSTDGWNWIVSIGRTGPDCWATNQDWGTGPFTQTDNHPVGGVTYYEAEAFCNWAGGHLPTEAQWERAARWTGTDPNVFPWGDAMDVQKCNNDSDSLYPGYQTAPVGSYPSGASPSGCQDMAGNIMEWCQDWYKSYPESPYPFDWTDFHYHTLRGGSWYNSAVNLRCAYRSYGQLPQGYVTVSGHVGFRLAR